MARELSFRQVGTTMNCTVAVNECSLSKSVWGLKPGLTAISLFNKGDL